MTTRWGTTMSWKEALQLPASGQMQFLRRLIESRPMLERTPDQSLIAGDISPYAGERVAALRGGDASYAFVYLPDGKTNVTVNTGRLTGTELIAWWYDPRTGKAVQLGRLAKSDHHQFSTPDNGDWVLVLDDAAKKYAAPGKGATAP